MVVESSRPPAEIAEAFVDIAHRIVWCTLATVDRRGRPRSRVVHPLWEHGEAGLTGWVTTRRTPLKRAHLASTPFASVSYWDARHDIAVAECEAAWQQEPAETARVWDLFRSAPPPLGFDPAALFAGAAGGPEPALLRLRPWRLRAGYADRMAAGEPALAWRAPERGRL